MPGLVRGIARTAVVAGTATATRNAVNRHSAKKNMEAYADAAEEVQGQHVTYVQQPQQRSPAPQAAPAPQTDVVSQLERLAALKDQGILTEEEFAAQKAKILGI